VKGPDSHVGRGPPHPNRKRDPTSPLRGEVKQAARPSRYSPNTNSMVWLRISRSSGVNAWRPFDIALKPERIATYCLPLTSKVMGGAWKPVPTLIFHSSCMVVVIGHQRSIGEAGEDKAAGCRQGAAVVRIRHAYLLLDLAGEGVGDDEVGLHALDVLERRTKPDPLLDQAGIKGDLIS